MVEVYLVDAFAEEAGGGNPAGVMPVADHLSDSQMQEIAKVMGVSETAFVLKGGQDYDVEVRFFTPTEEVDLCGHATIATFSLLNELSKLPNGKRELIQKTKAGLLEIKIRDDGSVLMRQATPKKIDKNLIVGDLQEAMSINAEAIGVDGVMNQAEIWSTGLEDILLPIKDVKTLKAMAPNMDKLTKLSQSLDVIGVHAFSIDEHQRVWCRNFAPACGIPEESATGTSNGALGAYLHLNLWKEDTSSFIAHQGDWMDQASRIHVNVLTKEEIEVWVGGKAKLRYVKEITHL